MIEPLDLNVVQQQLGLSRVDFARALGVHYQTLTKWQRGEQKPPAVALQLARALLWMQDRELLSAWLAIIHKS